MRFLQRVFGSDINQESDTSIAYASGDVQHSSAIPLRSSDLPWSNSLLPISSSSQSPISSIPSLSSRAFNNNVDELNSDFTIGNSFAYCDFKDDCTSRPSWRNYMAKSNVTNRQKSPSPRKTTKETENIGFSLSHAVFKRKQLRLPVPAFMKGDVS